MKKFATMMMIALMILAAAVTGASAEGNPTDWFELSVNDTVLTVRVPGDNWAWEISDPAALELITMETNGSMIASFMSTANAENEVSLILRSAEDATAAADETRVLGLSVDAANTITVESILISAVEGDWYEMDEGTNVLTVRLPGEDWGFEVVEPRVAELITMETTEGGFVASFMPTMSEFGMGQLVFTAGDGLQSRAIDLYAIESGELSVKRAETFEIVVPAEITEEAKAVEFKTVNVTGGTVNLRAAATTESETIAKLTKGDNARYLGQTVADEVGMEWHNIAYGEKTGWISAKYAKLGGEGYVRIVNGDCNMRTQPTLDSEVITVLKKETTIKYLGQGMTDERGTDWYKISNNGKEGWVSSQYAVFTAAPAPAKKTESKSSKKSDKTDYKYVKIQGGKCNLRKSADKESDSVMTLKNGTVAKYLDKQATDDRGVVWYKVSYNDKKGWVSSKYAKLTNDSGEKKSDKKEESKQDESDMRLVYNPNRYDMLQVWDMYSQDGQTIYVVGNFGTVNSNGEPSHFDSRKNVTMKLVGGAEVMLPADPSSDDNIRETADSYMWFNDARKAAGGSYMFYASFSMNEAGELRSLVYRPVY